MMIVRSGSVPAALLVATSATAFAQSIDD